MQRIIDIAKIAALASVTLLSLSGCLLLLQTSSAVHHADVASAATDLRVNIFIDAATTTATKLSGTLDSINRLCPGPTDPVRPCGALADVARTLATIRGTAGQVEIAARHENANLSTLDAQEANLFADVHAAIAAGTGTAKAATEAIQTATTSIAASKPLLDASTLTIGRVNHFLYSPLLIDTGKHGASIVAHTDGIVASGDKVAHRFANPPGTPWYKAAWHDGLQAGQLLYDFLR